MQQIFLYGLILVLSLLSTTIKADILLDEDFSGGTVPTGWNNTITQGTAGWLVRSAPAFGSTSGSFYAVFDDQILGAAVTPNEASLGTPVLNCTGRTAVYMRIEHYWQEVENTHAYIEISNNGGIGWTTLIEYELGSRGSLLAPQDTTFDITSYAADEDDVRVRFRYFDGGQAGRYWYLDDITIYSEEDVGVTDLILPERLGCSESFGANETVSVEITNFGFNPITNIPVTVQVTGGSVATLTGVLAGPLAGGESANLVLPLTVNMLADAVYDFDCYTTLVGDVYPANDGFTESHQQLVTTYPYLQDFNGTEGGWWAYQGSSSRKMLHGTLPYLDGPEGEGESWYCSAAGNNGNWVYLESPIFDLSAITDAQLSFDIKHRLHQSDYFQVQYSTNGGIQWYQLGNTEPEWYNSNGWWRNSVSNQVDEWTSVHIDVCNLVGNSCVKFRVRGRPYYGGSNGYFAIDNAAITTGGDVGVTAYIDPVDEGCLFSSTQQVTVRVYNHSCTAVSDVPITCEISNAVSLTLNEIIAGPIPAGGYVDHTFATTFDMTGLGTYEFDTYTQLVGDIYASNNHQLTVVDVNTPQISTFPHIEDFNSNNGYWTAYGDNPPNNNGRNFVYGTLPYLDGPEGEGNAWYVETTLSNQSTLIYLESPVFDFSDLTNPTLSFDIKHQLHGSDYFQVQYSTNGGDNWYQLGNAAEPTWYNSNGWWRSSSSSPVHDWTSMSKELCSLSGERCVKFRFRGRPYYGEPNYTGLHYFAIDNFEVSAGEDDDIEVLEIILTDGGACTNFSTTEPVSVTLRNNSCRPLTNIPVSVQVDAGTVVNEIIPGPISAFGFSTYTFTSTINLAAIGTHTISVTTNLATDITPGNDNVERTRISTNGISAFPYLENFNTDNGGWASRTTSATRHFNWGQLPYLNGPEGEGNSMYCETYTSTNGGQIWMESPVFDFSSLTQPHIAFDMKYQLHNSDYFKVQYSTNGGTTWIDINPDRPNWTNTHDWWRNNIGEPVNEWTQMHHSVCNLAGESCVQFRIYGRPFYGYPTYTAHGNLAIDNFEIKEGPDVAVTAYLGPIDEGCLFASDELVTVTVSNFGCFPVSDIPISCNVTGPINSNLIGTVPGPIPAGGSVNFTFPTPFDMTSVGIFNFSTTTAYPGDIFADNNTLETTININTLRISSYPFLEDFNSNDGFWTAYGDNPPLNNGRNFVHGTLPYLDGPEGEGDCWFVETTLSNQSTFIYLESPVFDFSELTNPTISFDLKHQLHGSDYFQVQYSINGGDTWSQLGSTASPTWYNSNGWWRSSSNSPVHDWTSMNKELCTLSGEACVKFRFRGRPYYSQPTYNGLHYFAIDNFEVNEGELDELETLEMVLSDAGNCAGLSSTEQVAVILRNNTCRPLTNVPIQLQVDGNPPITELIPGPIPRFSNYTYTLTNTADLSAVGTHIVSVTTMLSTDSDLTNNNVTRNRISGLGISSFPYSEDFNADNGGWTARQTNSASRYFHYDTVPYLNGSEGEGNSWHIQTVSNSGSWIYLESPVFDFTNLSSPEVVFDIKHSLHNSDYIRFEYSTNGGSNWTALGSTEPNWYNSNGWWRTSSSDPVDEWTQVQHDLCDIAGQSCVKFRINARPYYGGPSYPNLYNFAMDNFIIHEGVDVGVSAQVGPIDGGCLFSDEQEITIQVFNYISDGCAPIYNVPVTVDVSGEITASMSAVVPGPIPLGGSVSYTFASTIDMTALGTYNFSSYTEHPLDINDGNDTLIHTIEVEQYTVDTYPFLEDFNSDNGQWLAYGSNPPNNNGRNFVHGTLPYLNGPEGEGDSWYVETTLSNQSSWVYLETSVFDFTDVENPRMYFDLKHSLHNSDYFQMEYSTNGGSTWTRLGNTAHPQWYNTTHWWRNSAGNPVDEWTSMKQDLCFLAGQSCVKFRFRGRPYYSQPTYNGYHYFAIDNFQITDTDIDVELVDVTGCWGSDYSMEITVRNMNDLCITPDNITSLNIGYQLDGAPAVIQNFSGLNIPPNSTSTFTISGLTVPTQSSDLVVWTNAPNGILDHVASNDSLQANLSLWPQCNDHCSNSIELSLGTTTASQTSNATVNPTEDPGFFGCGPLTVENTVWYHFTTTASGGEVQVDFHDLLCAPSNNGIQVSILEVDGTACDPLNYTEVFCSSNENINDFVFGPAELEPETDYYIAVDGFAGNDCDFQITLSGSVTSEVDPPTTSDEVICGGSVNLSASGSTGNYRWYDQLIGGTLLFTGNPFTVTPLATTTYYVCAIDGSGLESTRIASTVTIGDIIDPTAVCQDIAVQLDGSGIVIVTASQVNNGSSDNCEITAMDLSPSVFNCTNIGANNAVLTVTDIGGNTNACNAEITVEDNTAPLASCQNLVLVLDASGNNSITPANIDGGSTDNCAISSLSISEDAFSCADLGDNNVTLTVSDPNGNTSNCTATVTVNGVTNPRVWNGSTSTDWHVDANWDCGGVPDETIGVIIPNVASESGNFPEIDGTGLCNDIRINALSMLTIFEGSSLEVSGNWNNSGAQQLGDGTVTFNGSIEQLIVGQNHFGGLRLDNALGLQVAFGNQSVRVKLELQEGDLATNGNGFTLKSTASRTAYINDFSPTFSGTITGDVTVERFISNAGIGYHYIGSPVDNATISDWDDDFGVTLWSGSEDGDQVIPTPDCNPSYLAGNSPYGNLFDFRENQVGTCYLDGWHVRGSGVLTNGHGFAANLPNATILDATGPATTGDVTINGQTHTTTTGDGFNLISNPFPSNLDWAGTIADPANSAFDGSAYLWVASGQYVGTYQPINPIMPTPHIASSQSFFVRLSNPGSSSFTLPQSARVEGDQIFYKTPEDFYGRLTVELNQANSADLTYLVFGDDFTLQHDRMADATKLSGLHTSTYLSSFSEMGEMAVNAIPNNSIPNRVPLKIKVRNQGEATFRIKELKDMPIGVSVYLENSETGDLILLSEDKEISYYLYEGESDNFSLVFQKSDRQIETIAPAIYVTDNWLNINLHSSDLDAQYSLYDMSGRKVVTQSKTGESVLKQDLSSLANGTYLVELVVEGKAYRKRVVWVTR